MATLTIAAPYEILDLVGQGAMGQVFRARHTGLDRIEAIKVLSPELAADQEFVVRLRREARATTLLTHPNIVSVYGFGRLPDGRYYLAMEFLQGETLEHLCTREHALPLDTGMRLLFQLASAMAHAHEQHVVHRDIKPANLMVEDQDTPVPYLKVLDFGLAKIISPSYAESVAVSKSGSIYGTPGYMAPERVRGVTDDPGIDVYSFGCVAYTVLTGQAPFVGRAIDVLRAHQDLEPRPVGERRDVPRALEQLVMRCLRKDPAERFGNGRELCAALHAVEGFSAEQARRRSLPPTLTGGQQALGTAIETGESRPLATTMRTDMDLEETLSFAQSYDFGYQHAEVGYYQALLRLGEALHRAGCRERRLIRCMADLKRQQTRLRAHDERLSELLRAREAADQHYRKNESELRFALGECSFDVEAESRQGLEARANDLTEELIRADHMHRRASKEILDREIAEVAAREHVAEAQRNAYGLLLPIVDAYLEEAQPDAELLERIDDFRKAKLAWESAIRNRQPL